MWSKVASFVVGFYVGAVVDQKVEVPRVPLPGDVVEMVKDLFSSEEKKK